MNNMRYKKLVPEAATPVYATEGSAGLDLVATSVEATDDFVKYGTGLGFEVPPGYLGLLVAGSRITKKDITLKNCVGIIDSDFRGEVEFRYQESAGYLWKMIKAISAALLTFLDGHDKKAVLGLLRQEFLSIGASQRVFKVGDVVGQMVIIPVERVNLMDVGNGELSKTERNGGGWGSTENKTQEKKE